MSMDFKLLRSILDIALKHVDKLQADLDDLVPYLPIKANWLISFDKVNRRSIDGFVLNFLKLQDWISTKIFPNILILKFEVLETGSFIDLLNKLEKIYVIESAEQWKSIRKLRNLLTHEYPHEYEKIADNLNKAIELTPIMFDAVKRFEEEIGKAE